MDKMDKNKSTLTCLLETSEARLGKFLLLRALEDNYGAFILWNCGGTFGSYRIFDIFLRTARKINKQDGVSDAYLFLFLRPYIFLAKQVGMCERVVACLEFLSVPRVFLLIVGVVIWNGKECFCRLGEKVSWWTSGNHGPILLSNALTWKSVLSTTVFGRLK